MTDVDRLTQVLAIARSAKLAITAIAVGDIRLVLASPTEAERPAARELPKSEREMAELRARARQLFGKDLPDEELREMKGAL